MKYLNKANIIKNISLLAFLLIVVVLVGQTPPKQITYLYLWDATARKWIGLNVTLDGLNLVPTTAGNAILRATASANVVPPIITAGSGLISVALPDGSTQLDINAGYVSTVTSFPVSDPGIVPGPCVVPGISGTYGTASVVKTPTATYTCVPDGKMGFVWSRQANATSWDPATAVK